MAQKPSIPKGTRDFGPAETARRNYIFDTIRGVFALFGYRAIETPAMENLSTLMGKYGEEGDKLLFKILNSGNWHGSLTSEILENESTGALTGRVSEKGLRYDLTVPFARFVVQHRNEIQFPFRRYQIQPVWRADRPQKGRYREFFQCDADVVGSDSLLNEVELLQMIDMVFDRLGINVIVKLNNRKILAGIAELLGLPDRIVDITVAIDKVDKIGMDGVEAELLEKGIDSESIERLKPILAISGTIDERIERLQELLSTSEIGLKGVEELRFIVEKTRVLGLNAELELDVALARGLNYYTGAIIEVKARDFAIGSISGGGRYDNLTGVFGMPGVSGVGVSFGADRIYDVLNGLNLFPDEMLGASQVMFLNLGEKEVEKSLDLIKKLRRAGVSAEVYPDNAKMKKQMNYANDTDVAFVAIVGSTELAEGTVSVKDMKTGQQTVVADDKLVEFFKTV